MGWGNRLREGITEKQVSENDPHPGENRRNNDEGHVQTGPRRCGGRGPGGEVWKLEDNLYDGVKLCAGVLSERPLFVLINSYTTGLAPSVLGYLLHLLVGAKYGGKCTWDELGLPVTETGLALPCGATGRWCSE